MKITYKCTRVSKSVDTCISVGNWLEFQNRLSVLISQLIVEYLIDFYTRLMFSEILGRAQRAFLIGKTRNWDISWHSNLMIFSN